MYSVTQRINNIKQPSGGYLPVKEFEKTIIEDGQVLNENENIHSSLIGIVVDYLSRYCLGSSVEEAFHISLLGSKKIKMYDKALILLKNIKGLDDESIIFACKLSGFDVCYRSSIKGYKPIEEINPDINTIENIRIMVKRSLLFFEKYGPVKSSELTFEGGYSEIVSSGDADFLTEDTLWDFKVTKNKITTKHTLQILMYYIMGLHSIYGYYKNIKQLGFYNPRLNDIHIYSIEKINKEIIKEIEEKVICYGSTFDNIFSPSKIKKNDIDEMSVSEISNLTGLEKNIIYKDIKSGKLVAYKKSNKYYVKKEIVECYIDSIKKEDKIFKIVYIVAVCIILLIVIIFVIIVSTWT